MGGTRAIGFAVDVTRVAVGVTKSTGFGETLIIRYAAFSEGTF